MKLLTQPFSKFEHKIMTFVCSCSSLQCTSFTHILFFFFLSWKIWLSTLSFHYHFQCHSTNTLRLIFWTGFPPSASVCRCWGPWVVQQEADTGGTRGVRSGPRRRQVSIRPLNVVLLSSMQELWLGQMCITSNSYYNSKHFYCNSRFQS